MYPTDYLSVRYVFLQIQRLTWLSKSSIILWEMLLYSSKTSSSTHTCGTARIHSCSSSSLSDHQCRLTTSEVHSRLRFSSSLPFAAAVSPSWSSSLVAATRSVSLWSTGVYEAMSTRHIDAGSWRLLKLSNKEDSTSSGPMWPLQSTEQMHR